MKRTSYSLASLFTVALTFLLTSVASPAIFAQAVGLTAKPLLRTTLSDDDTKQTIMMTVEFAPGATTGRHLHHGDEYATVIQGTLELSTEGRESRRVSAGDAFHNPRGVIHEARNVGDTPTRLNIIFIVDKGKPIVEPVTK